MAGVGPAAPHRPLWPAQIQEQLRASAAGSPQQGWAAAAAALQHGAEADTLRQLCPARAPKMRGPSDTLPEDDEALGRLVCAAVATPQTERGAALLGCAGAGQRCRLAGELWAEAGLMQEAAQALRRAGRAGDATAWALWQERQLGAPPWLTAAAPRGLRAWPQGATLGPKQLGFSLADRPGTLTWHPTGPGPGGALCARSPYRGALITHVPVPTAGPRPTGACLCLRGAADLAITLEGPGGVHTLRCAPSDGGPTVAGLPAAACSGAWTRLQLGPPPGAQQITAARIHGEFLLADWAWRGAGEGSW
jgi:hypothetical protein